MRRTEGPRKGGAFSLVPLTLVAAEVERSSDAAARRLSWSVWGLLGLAAVIAVGTVVFWWITRPERRSEAPVAMAWLATPGDDHRSGGFTTEARPEPAGPVLPPLSLNDPARGSSAVQLGPPMASEPAGNVWHG